MTIESRSISTIWIVLLMFGVVFGGSSNARVPSLPRNADCQFDYGSAILSSECKARARAIAACWFDVRVPAELNISKEHMIDLIRNGKPFRIIPFMSKDEWNNLQNNKILFERAKAISDYFFSLGLPRSSMSIDTETGISNLTYSFNSRDPLAGQSALMQGCLADLYAAPAGLDLMK